MLSECRKGKLTCYFDLHDLHGRLYEVRVVLRFELAGKNWWIE